MADVVKGRFKKVFRVLGFSGIVRFLVSYCFYVFKVEYTHSHAEQWTQKYD